MSLCDANKGGESDPDLQFLIFWRMHISYTENCLSLINVNFNIPQKLNNNQKKNIYNEFRKSGSGPKIKL